MPNFCQACKAEVAMQFRFCPTCGGRDLRPAQSASVGTSSPQLVASVSVLQQGGAPNQVSLLLPAAGTQSIGYGGFWRRLGAYAIDSLLLVALFFCILIVFAIVMPNLEAEGLDRVFNVLFIVVAWIYFANMECGPRQATLGKRALGLRVSDEQGRRLSFGKASGRFFGKYLSALILGIGFLMIAVTKRKQGLHDKLAGTLVLHSVD